MSVYTPHGRKTKTVAYFQAAGGIRVRSKPEVANDYDITWRSKLGFSLTTITSTIAGKTHSLNAKKISKFIHLLMIIYNLQSNYG